MFVTYTLIKVRKMADHAVQSAWISDIDGLRM